MTGPTTRIPSAQVRGFRLDSAGLSHVGLVRSANEDAVLTDAARGLFAVADGMGGHGHGDVAARIVTAALASKGGNGLAAAELVDSLREANSSIRDWAASRGIRQMGATAVVTVVNGKSATVAWAGDSRVYRFDSSGLAQVTRDHSVVQELVESGQLTAAEAERHPHAHMVTRAIGAADELEVELAETDLTPGGGLLLCSDGLTTCVEDREIAALLAAAPDASAACRSLIDAALRRGAPDNVSVVVVRVEGVERP
jgi:serine/threonine protein phosphatase PrpC